MAAPGVHIQNTTNHPAILLLLNQENQPVHVSIPPGQHITLSDLPAQVLAAKGLRNIEAITYVALATVLALGAKIAMLKSFPETFLLLGFACYNAITTIHWRVIKPSNLHTLYRTGTPPVEDEDRIRARLNIEKASQLALSITFIALSATVERFRFEYLAIGFGVFMVIKEVTDNAVCVINNVRPNWLKL